MKKRLSIKKVIIFSVITLIVLVLSYFAVVIFVRAAEIDNAVSEFLSLDVSTQNCIASQKYCVSGDVEKEDRDTFLYSYQKNGDSYNIYCRSFDIEDNVIYLGGKQAEISDEDALDRYEGLFVRHDSPSYVPQVEKEMLVYDPTEIAEALQKYRFTYIGKTVNGNVAEYKLFLSRGFYRYILRNAYANYETREIKKSLFEPLIMTVENGILKSIKFDVGGYFFTRSLLGEEYKIDRKYCCEIYYSDDSVIKDLDSNAEKAFYRAFLPCEIVRSDDVNAKAEFYKGKLYLVENRTFSNENGMALKIIDLKNKKIETEKVLSENSGEFVSSISVKDGYVYVGNSYGRVYEYNIDTNNLSFKDGCHICSFTENGIIVNIENEFYSGEDIDSLLKQDEVKFHSYNGEAGRYYLITTENGKKIISLTDNNGEVVKEITIDDFYFNSSGIVVMRYDDEINGESIELQLDYDLNETETVESDSYLKSYVRYLDETDGFILYNTYIKNKDNEEKYYLSPSYSLCWYVYDDIAYFFSNGVLYSSENYTTTKSDDRLFSR